MACNENLLNAILQLSGIRDDNGDWHGSSGLADLLIRVSRENLEKFHDLGQEACVNEIVENVRRETNVEIPRQYNLGFWSSDLGIEVKGVMDKKLPQLPEVRKNNS